MASRLCCPVIDFFSEAAENLFELVAGRSTTLMALNGDDFEDFKRYCQVFVAENTTF